MKCDFVVGQKVVLVHDFDPGVRASAPGDGITLPQMGVVYTIREIGLYCDEPIVWLNEIVNEPHFYIDIFDVAEQGFGATRFRPVVEKKTDISVFTAMLAPAGRLPVDA